MQAAIARHSGETLNQGAASPTAGPRRAGPCSALPTVAPLAVAVSFLCREHHLRIGILHCGSQLATASLIALASYTMSKPPACQPPSRRLLGRGLGASSRHNLYPLPGQEGGAARMGRTVDGRMGFSSHCQKPRGLARTLQWRDISRGTWYNASQERSGNGRRNGPCVGCVTNLERVDSGT